MYLAKLEYKFWKNTLLYVYLTQIPGIIYSTRANELDIFFLNFDAKIHCHKENQ